MSRSAKRGTFADWSDEGDEGDEGDDEDGGFMDLFDMIFNED